MRKKRKPHEEQTSEDYMEAVRVCANLRAPCNPFSRTREGVGQEIVPQARVCKTCRHKATSHRRAGPRRGMTRFDAHPGRGAMPTPEYPENWYGGMFQLPAFLGNTPAAKVRPEMGCAKFP
jgi:hypothetical protein